MKKYLWGILYGLILTVFTVYVVMDPISFGFSLIHPDSTEPKTIEFPKGNADYKLLQNS